MRQQLLKTQGNERWLESCNQCLAQCHCWSQYLSTQLAESVFERVTNRWTSGRRAWDSAIGNSVQCARTSTKDRKTSSSDVDMVDSDAEMCDRTSVDSSQFLITNAYTHRTSAIHYTAAHIIDTTGNGTIYMGNKTWRTHNMSYKTSKSISHLLLPYWHTLRTVVTRTVSRRHICRLSNDTCQKAVCSPQSSGWRSAIRISWVFASCRPRLRFLSHRNLLTRLVFPVQNKRQHKQKCSTVVLEAEWGWGSRV